MSGTGAVLGPQFKGRARNEAPLGGEWIADMYEDSAERHKDAAKAQRLGSVEAKERSWKPEDREKRHKLMAKAQREGAEK